MNSRPRAAGRAGVGSRLRIGVSTLIFGLLGVLPIQAAAQDKPNTLSETYENWVVRCVVSAAAVGAAPAKACEMAQDIRKRSGGERVLAVVIGVKPGETKPKLTLLTPLGLQLSDGVRLFLDAEQKPLVDLTYATCFAAGCIVMTDFTPSLSDRLAKGTSVRVAMRVYQGQSAEVPVSLRGFDVARKRLDELEGN